MKTISTKPSSAQGLMPSWWSYDEIAEATDRDLYDALHYGEMDIVDPETEVDESKIGGSMGMIISTRSNIPNSLFANIHDDIALGHEKGRNKHWFMQVFSADPSKPLYTLDQALAANPSVGYTISKKTLRRDLEGAINDVSARPGFRSRRLNIESGTQDQLVDPESWNQIAQPESFDSIWKRLKGERVILGVDLGATRSLTSIGLYFPDRKLLVAESWMARTQVQKLETIHNATYSKWIESGELRGIASDRDGGMTYRPIAEFLRDCIEHFDVKSLRYDGWNINRVFDALTNLGLRQDHYPLKRILDKFVPGAKEYGEAIIEFTDAVLNKRIVHNANGVSNLGIYVCQVETKMRGSDEVKVPAKNKQQMPNDPAIAMLMAFSNRGLVLPEKSRLSFAERVAAA
ncbi:MAG: hypothetical protein ISN29_00060, partial [Gammaproteobacteria bacterium AqS3]|nr:hypothetical protein [Gammaproteobacteria bacterium AqS3]